MWQARKEIIHQSVALCLIAQKVTLHGNVASFAENEITARIGA